MRRAVVPALLLLALAPACGGGASGSQPKITVQLSLWDAERPTQGNPVQLKVTVDGAAPNSVEIWIDGAKVLQAPANEDPAVVYQSIDLVWYASPSDLDGPHSIWARAIFAGIQVDSPEQSFVLDRASPRVTSLDPAAGSKSVCPGDVFTLRFDEPLERWPDSGLGGGVVVGFSLDDGGVIPSFPMLTADGGTIITATRPIPDAGTPSGSLTLKLFPQLTDLAGNSVEPYEASWPLAATCPAAGP